jgi:hypothetical protein
MTRGAQTFTQSFRLADSHMYVTMKCQRSHVVQTDSTDRAEYKLTVQIEPSTN